MNPTPPGDGSPATAPLALDPKEASRRGWSPEAIVTALFLLALLLRILIVARTWTIAADGATYLKTAQMLVEGQFDAAFRYQGVQPTFPMFTAVAAAPLRSVETGAYVVSVLAAALTVVPLFWMCVLLFGVRVAGWTGLIYAFHPMLALEATEVRNTGLFLFLLVATLTLYFYALRDGNWAWYALSGITGALCYLTRSEGLYLIPFMTGATVVKVVRLMRSKSKEGASPRFPTWIRFVSGALLTALLFFITAFPWVLYLHRMAGRWFPSARGAALKVWLRFSPDDPEPGASSAPPAKAQPPPVAAAPPPVAPAEPKVPATPAAEPTPPPNPARPDAPPERRSFVYECAKRVSRAIYPPLLPFALLGLVAAWRDRTSRASWIGLFSMIAVTGSAPIAAWILNPAYRLSDRYLLPAIVLLVPVMGMAAVWLHDLLASKVVPRLPRRGPLVAPSLLAILLMAATVPKLAPSRRADEASFLEAARWLRTQPRSPSPSVLTSSDKISFHAGYDAVDLPRLQEFHSYVRGDSSLLPNFTSAAPPSAEESAQAALKELRRCGAKYLIVEEKGIDQKMIAPFFKAIEALGLNRAATFGDPAKKTLLVWIYRTPS